MVVGGARITGSPYSLMDNFLLKHEVAVRSKTALILCTYIRLENFSKTAECLLSQTNIDFDIYICNNSDKEEKLLGLVKKYLFESGHNIFIKNYYNDFKAFARFMLAQELALEGYEKIIFIDDDEIFSPQFIQDCYDQYEENSVKSFWAHKVEKKYNKKIKLEKEEIGNYAGTGGLVCSSSLFLNDDFFDCPEEYWIVDDLWLSFYILKFTDLKIKELKTNIRFIKDLKATFLTVGDLKQRFLEEFITPNSKHIKPLM